MHMIHMLGILSLVMVVGLFLLCFFREKLNHPIINPLFIAVTAAFFFCWNYAAFERGWLEDGFMTLENISPYICTVIIFTPFLNKTVKHYAHCAIAFLGFGMFLALFVSPNAEFLMNYQQEASFIHVSEGACHLVMALYGFYLFLSDRVALNMANCCRAVVFMYASIFFGVFLNWCFHLENFGMAMYGNYKIYFLDIFGSFEITFAAYLLGVFATILLGYLAGSSLDHLSRPKSVILQAEITEEIITENEQSDKENEQA